MDDLMAQIKDKKCEIFDYLVVEENFQLQMRQVQEKRSKVTQELGDLVKKYNDESAKSQEKATEQSAKI